MSWAGRPPADRVAGDARAGAGRPAPGAAAVAVQRGAPDRAGQAPRVGQDTHEIAAEVYDGARVEALIVAGALFADP